MTNMADVDIADPGGDPDGIKGGGPDNRGRVYPLDLFMAHKWPGGVGSTFPGERDGPLSVSLTRTCTAHSHARVSDRFQSVLRFATRGRGRPSGRDGSDGLGRYRLARLRELFGDRLQDPAGRAAPLLAA